MPLVHQGILPEFKITKAMQKITAKKHWMTGEDFKEAIIQGFELLFLSRSLLMDMDQMHALSVPTYIKL